MHDATTTWVILITTRIKFDVDAVNEFLSLKVRAASDDDLRL